MTLVKFKKSVYKNWNLDSQNRFIKEFFSRTRLFEYFLYGIISSTCDNNRSRYDHITKRHKITRIFIIVINKCILYILGFFDNVVDGIISIKKNDKPLLFISKNFIILSIKYYLIY